MPRKLCTRCLAPSPPDATECPRDHGALVTVEEGPPPIGEVIRPGYLVLGHLASGGMGRVFRAHQLSMGRAVALKLLPATTSHDPELVERFRRETETVAQLSSPHTVRAYDAGRLDSGELFLAMELLAGRPLDAILDGEAPLEPARAVRLMRHVCLSLAEAHERGIVHRDVKPSNIFVELIPGAGEHAKVLDFGLVKFFSAGRPSRPCGPLGRSSAAAGASAASRPDAGVVKDHDTHCELTMVRQVCGTPAYMAPEMWRGGEGAIGPAADVYALGVTLYKMLAGRAPFVGGTPAELEELHLHERPPPLGALRTRADQAALLGAIVERCLEKKPFDRYASARDLLAALDLVGSTLERAPSSAGAPKSGPAPEETIPPGALPRETRPEHPVPALPPTAPEPTPIADPRALDTSASRFAPRQAAPSFTPAHALLAASCGALLVATWLAPEVIRAARLPRPEPRGTLRVESAPADAVVFLDGAPTGQRTPAVIAGLPLGRTVRVSVQRAGYASAEQAVTISTPAAQSATLRLEPAFGTVNLESPPGQVLVDGRKIDASAPVRLPVGVHVVTAPEIIGQGRRVIAVELGEQSITLGSAGHP